MGCAARPALPRSLPWEALRMRSRCAVTWSPAWGPGVLFIARIALPQSLSLPASPPDPASSSSWLSRTWATARQTVSKQPCTSRLPGLGRVPRSPACGCCGTCERARRPFPSAVHRCLLLPVTLGLCFMPPAERRLSCRGVSRTPHRVTAFPSRTLHRVCIPANENLLH